MDLGNFSVSLAVKDIEASKRFYEKLGFKVFGGDQSQNWLILKNGDHAIGLFQGMFEKNILTFNPGWDRNAQKLAKFTDIRDLQRQLRAQGVQLQQPADESTTLHSAVRGTIGSWPSPRSGSLRTHLAPSSSIRRASTAGPVASSIPAISDGAAAACPSSIASRRRSPNASGP